MTLEEAIKHAEEVAEEKENEAQDLEYSKLDWRYEAHQCSECAEEHRQLAEWLKELKQLREQTRWVPVSEKLPEDFGKYLITLKDGDVCLCDFNPDYWIDKASLSMCTVAWMPFEPYKSESEVQHDRRSEKLDNQESVLDKVRVELIQAIQNGTLKLENGNEELFRILDKYKTESQCPTFDEWKAYKAESEKV